METAQWFKNISHAFAEISWSHGLYLDTSVIAESIVHCDGSTFLEEG